MSTLMVATPDIRERMVKAARQRAKYAWLQYRRHVEVLCRAECIRGSVCHKARELDLEASAADWALARLRDA